MKKLSALIAAAAVTVSADGGAGISYSNTPGAPYVSAAYTVNADALP